MNGYFIIIKKTRERIHNKINIKRSIKLPWYKPTAQVKGIFILRVL